MNRREIGLLMAVIVGFFGVLWQANAQERAEIKAETGRDRIGVLRYKIQDLVEDIRGQVRRKENVATAASEKVRLSNSGATTSGGSPPTRT